MKVSYLCGNHSGVLGMLMLKALKHEIVAMVCYKTECKEMAKVFDIPYSDSVKDPVFIEKTKNADMLFSVHAREFIPQSLIQSTHGKLGINVHPYLYCYKGGYPVNQAIKDGNWKASVGVHHLTDEWDSGPVVLELFREIKPVATKLEVHEQLNSLYCEAIMKALRMI